MGYIPPFTITNKMLEYVSSIMENIGEMNSYQSLSKMPILRKNNRIRSIHSSLAIEANSLSLGQVKDIINEKVVIGPKKEIEEVKNANRAYGMMEQVNPYSITDLKRVHKEMMSLLIENLGEYRLGREGVFDGEKCIFMAPGPDMISSLMNDLFSWMEQNKEELSPLILSSVFHYEFVFIHPFLDGNGRMARLWQTVILGHWKDIFYYMPIETQIKKYQEEYYQVIDTCNHLGNSTLFVEFMLHMIDESLKEIISQSNIDGVNQNVRELLDAMMDIPMTSREIMVRLGIKSKETFRNSYLNPAMEIGLVKMTIPDKPTSKNQKYYK